MGLALTSQAFANCNDIYQTQISEMERETEGTILAGGTGGLVVGGAIAFTALATEGSMMGGAFATANPVAMGGAIAAISTTQATHLSTEVHDLKNALTLIKEAELGGGPQTSLVQEALAKKSIDISQEEIIEIINELNDSEELCAEVQAMGKKDIIEHIADMYQD